MSVKSKWLMYMIIGHSLGFMYLFFVYVFLCIFFPERGVANLGILIGLFLFLFLVQEGERLSKTFLINVAIVAGEGVIISVVSLFFGPEKFGYIVGFFQNLVIVWMCRDILIKGMSQKIKE